MVFAQINKIYCIIFLVANLNAETFFTTPKKKQPKLTIEQVCHNMMPENIISARINSLLGQNQVTGLCLIDDSIEELPQAIFSMASQEKLQEFNQAEQKYISELEHFEKVLLERREYLKNWKQQVLAPKNKK